MIIPPLQLKRVKVYPLEQRKSEAQIEEIIVPADRPEPCSPENLALIAECAKKIRKARESNRTVMLIYGAHLVKNGGSQIMIDLIRKGWITHLATNGAGTIHDWEFSYLGRSTESVQKNVATGTFGTWDETGRNIHLAILAGGLVNEGYGRALGRFIHEDGCTLPSRKELTALISSEPANPLTPARAELLNAMVQDGLPEGRIRVEHPFKKFSIIGEAFAHDVPLTVHPGIGYDIISNHPMFNGAAIGRGAHLDFAQFGGAVERLDDGVTMSIGSAIMGPQVFEKSISCVNNIRLQEGRAVVKNHAIYVVDLQDGGNWDWRTGEPPKDNPAYYLRFCKSFSRMGGEMNYAQCDNVAFIQNLLQFLEK
ncbi:MAG: hypothetical protein JWN25_2685 [Verrucomicrobiales bacterium]|nr:hypothetical protein [Verrucomicrobiales bacterium]